MLVTDFSGFIDYDDCRHASELEPFDGLPELPGKFVVGVRNADELHLVLIPEILELLRLIRTGYDDLCLSVDKLLIVLAQLRHVPAAVRSHQCPVENQNNMFLPEVIG